MSSIASAIVRSASMSGLTRSTPARSSRLWAEVDRAGPLPAVQLGHRLEQLRVAAAGSGS